MSRFAPERVLITRKRHLSRDYYSITMGPCSRIGSCKPGQFIHLGLPGRSVFFRRAMSIAAVDKKTREMEIIFKVFGRGTTILSTLCKGDELDVVGPLGNGFRKPSKKDTCLLIGGGVGFPPLYYLAKKLTEDGFDPKRIEFFYGGRTAGEIVERSRIRKLGVVFRPVTDDGSFGLRGLVTEVVEEYIGSNDGAKLRLYACGPEPMLKAVDEMAMRLNVPGQLSLEAPMPCGIGVCLGCIVPLRAGGYARVCADGPVFKTGEVEL